MTKENLYHRTRRNRSEKSGTTIYKKTKVEKLPIVNKQGKLTGLIYLQ